QHDTGEGTLGPALAGDADHGSLEDRRVPHESGFQLDGGDPLAARLHQVLGAVHQLHGTALVHDRDVAGSQPTVDEPVGTRGGVVVGRGHPVAFHLDLAHRLRVPGNLGTVLGHYPGADPAND